MRSGMLDETWLTITAAAALVGFLALAGRVILRRWKLRQLKVLTRESFAIRRCWVLLDQLPTDLLTQHIRMTFGKIMYVRLKTAQKIRPGHLFLRDQQLQIAHLIGTTRGGRGGALSNRDREDAMGALEALKLVLQESAADGIISELEQQNCAERLNEALSALQLAHYKQAATEAEGLERIPQAIAHLRCALRSAEQLPSCETERKRITRHLQQLESVSGF